MSGLDKIIEEIGASAKAEADIILQKADQYCEEYMANVKKEVQQEVEHFEKNAEAQRNLYREKTKSGAGFRERNAILKAKPHPVQEGVTRAGEKLEHLPENEDFDFLTRLLEKNVQPQNGIIFFSEKDMKRMPENFKARIENVAKEKGGQIEFSSDRADVENGFVLVYGEIEENCRIKALFEADMGRLKDIANRKLFG